MNRDIYSYILNIIADIPTLLAFSSTCKEIYKLYSKNKEKLIEPLIKLTLEFTWGGFRIISDSDQSIFGGFYIVIDDMGETPNVSLEEKRQYLRSKVDYDEYVKHYMSLIDNDNIGFGQLDAQRYPRIGNIAEMGRRRTDDRIDPTTYDITFRCGPEDTYSVLIARYKFTQVYSARFKDNSHVNP